MSDEPYRPNTMFPLKPEWMRRGNCRTAARGTMFPTAARDELDAVSVCFGCPVKTECLTYAVDNNEYHGVWGGLTEDQRRSMRSRRRLAAV